MPETPDLCEINVGKQEQENAKLANMVNDTEQPRGDVNRSAAGNGASMACQFHEGVQSLMNNITGNQKTAVK